MEHSMVGGVHSVEGSGLPRVGTPATPTAKAVARLSPLGLNDLVLADGSELGDWQQRNRAYTIPHCVAHVRASGALRNLERVAYARTGASAHEGMHFSDSDIYKLLEAIAWDHDHDAAEGVAQFVDEAVTLLRAAQREDGYLNSWFQGQRPDLIWKDLRWGHELYCAGHLLQAAVASRRTGAAPGLFDVASRLVDHLLQTFSRAEGDGGLVGVCGHPEVETALVEFYRLTGDERALALARHQVDMRGQDHIALPTSGLLGDSRFPLSYFLHHIPVRDRTAATGHAVRELYLQAGVVDVAVETGDQELLGASEAIWEDLHATKTYVTGGLGSRHRDESIGDAYELPSDRAYAETCAAIASFHWNWRLLLATGRSRYAEAMERVLWNTIAGAVSRAGTEFFYSNTLHLRTGHDGADEDAPRCRLAWYACACCPPNLARLMASIQAYLVTRDRSGLQVHMPFSGALSTAVPGGALELTVRSGHPWDGGTELEVAACTSTEPWALSLRAPEWAGQKSAQVVLNGAEVRPSLEDGYLRLRRRWFPGDRLQVTQAMPVRGLRPHWRVDGVRECVALQRGPLIYCVEAEDLDQGTAIEDVSVAGAQSLEPSLSVPPGLDGYVKVVLRGTGQRVEEADRPLYEDGPAGGTGSRPLELTFVPYFARSNRPSPHMRVWVPLRPGAAAATNQRDERQPSG